MSDQQVENSRSGAKRGKQRTPAENLRTERVLRELQKRVDTRRVKALQGYDDALEVLQGGTGVSGILPYGANREQMATKIGELVDRIDQELKRPDLSDADRALLHENRDIYEIDRGFYESGHTGSPPSYNARLEKGRSALALDDDKFTAKSLLDLKAHYAQQKRVLAAFPAAAADAPIDVNRVFMEEHLKQTAAKIDRLELKIGRDWRLVMAGKPSPRLKHYVIEHVRTNDDIRTLEAEGVFPTERAALDRIEVLNREQPLPERTGQNYRATFVPVEEEGDAIQEPGAAAGPVREGPSRGEEVREGDTEGGEAPGTRAPQAEAQEVAPPASRFTTPGTRLTWATGQEWADQAEVLRTGRGISAKVHRDRKSHLEALSDHIHEMVARGQTREDLEAILDHVKAWYVPPRGQRAGTPYEVVINEVNNALARLTKGERDVQAPAQTEDHPREQGRQEEKVRPTRPDGRLIPQVGDKVYQMVRGFGGSPAYIYGEVFKGRGDELRVKMTGSASMLGGGSTSVGKTQRLNEYWTVVDDPEIGRRKAAREKAEQDRKEEIEREHAEHLEGVYRKSREAIEGGHRPLTRETPVGARVVNYWAKGEIGTVDEQHPDYGPTIDGRTLGNADSDGTWRRWLLGAARPDLQRRGDEGRLPAHGRPGGGRRRRAAAAASESRGSARGEGRPGWRWRAAPGS
jgi:hypothetical protein